MHLLKNNTPLFLDDQAQQDLNNLKHALTHSLMLHPLNYSKVFLLYAVASTTTISMVLVQEDLNGQEHVIYYLSKSLLDFETFYSHVENLALSTFIDVHNFLHYILLRTTIFLANKNPMYYILTHQVLGGKYSCWIVILQEFDLDFTKATAKNSLVFV